MSLAGPCPVVVPSHRLPAAGPSARATPLASGTVDTLRAAVPR